MNPVAEAATPNSPMPAPASIQARGRQRRAVLFVGLAFLALGLGSLAVWGYYRAARNQLEVTIHFNEAYGLRNGADVRHRGVIVGRVIDVRIRPNSRGVSVRVKLQSEAEHLARAGSQFYIVRPTVSLNNGIRGLETAIGDVYVEAMRPPNVAGEPQTEFEGSEEIPVAEPIAGSRQYTLHARRRSFGLRPGAQVTCAGFEIGQVCSVKLADDGRSVTAILSIDPKFVRLMRVNSRFIESKPLVAEGSPLNLKLSVDLAALTGGIEMIPPEKPENEAPDGHTFQMAN